MHTYDDLLSKALLLSDKERALMAERLVSSLDPAYDIDSEKEWQEEIERRLNGIDKGDVKLLSWNTVKKQLR